MNIIQRKSLFLLSIVFVYLIIPTVVFAQKTSKTVAILPFQLNAPPDKGYLAEGLRDMLGSRLRTEVGANIVAKNTVQAALQGAGGESGPKQWGAVAGKVGADHVIFGTITALGGGISIDAKVYATDTGKVQDFYSSATTSDRIMHSIDTLSWDIIEKFYDKKRPASLQPFQAQAPAQEAQSSFTTAHPDKTFMASGGGIALSGGRNFVKTRNFNMDLRGFDIGDVDGDGTPEVILADKGEVHVYRRDGTRLNLLGMVKMLVRYQVHAVNTADLNGNGRAEIYISASDPMTPGSRAVEWDGKAFVDLFNEARWYIRPMEVSGMGQVLTGQAGGAPLAVEPGIFILSNVDGKLQKQQKLSVPKNVNLFDFAFADLDGNGKDDIVAVDSSFKLRVIQNGTTVWKSQERFAGTKRFIGGEPPMRGRKSIFENEEVDAVGERFQQIYIPSRILISDVDGDGSDDIILNRNPDTITTVAPNLIQYPNGTLVGLKWNGIGLEELWRTRRIDGYVVDYHVKSVALESKTTEDDELFIGMMLNAGSFNPFTADKSTVVIYPFEFEMPETK